MYFLLLVGNHVDGFKLVCILVDGGTKKLHIREVVQSPTSRLRRGQTLSARFCRRLAFQKCFHVRPDAHFFNGLAACWSTVSFLLILIYFSLFSTGWWFGTFSIVLFFHILGILVPIDFHIILRGVGTPPTSFSLISNLHKLSFSCGSCPRDADKWFLVLLAEIPSGDDLQFAIASGHWNSEFFLDNRMMIHNQHIIHNNPHRIHVSSITHMIFPLKSHGGSVHNSYML